MPTAVQAAFGALLGALVGALMAAPQAFMLRRRIKQAGRWVAIRALAWSIALPSLLLAGAWIANMSAYGIMGLVLAMFASFALVGAFVGLVEGYALTRLMRLVVDWQVRVAAPAVPAPVVPAPATLQTLAGRRRFCACRTHCPHDRDNDHHHYARSSRGHSRR
jgi:hypothetical protein